MKNIIDISHWNPIEDWNKIKADPQVEGIMIHITRGVGVHDPEAENNINGARSHGIPFGVYHFATMFHTGEQEAQFMISALKLIGKFDMPVALDLEENKSGRSKQDVELFVNDFFRTLADAGYSDIVFYTNRGFVYENLPAGHSLGVFPLWHSEYPKNYIEGMRPDLPNGWDKCWAWQYAESGIISGISEHVDKSILMP